MQTGVYGLDGGSPVTCRGFQGFTLVELLVTVAIIALLVGLVIPGLNGARGRAYAAKCIANLRQVGLAQQMYGNDHRFRYTPTWQPGVGSKTWQEVLEPYIQAKDRTDPKLVLSCPVRQKSVLSANRASYAMNVYITWPQWNFDVARVESPNRIILLGDCVESNSDIMYNADREQTWGVPGFRHDDKTVANMLFCDQSVRGLTYDELVLASGHWYWW